MTEDLKPAHCCEGDCVAMFEMNRLNMYLRPMNCPTRRQELAVTTARPAARRPKAPGAPAWLTMLQVSNAKGMLDSIASRKKRRERIRRNHLGAGLPCPSPSKASIRKTFAFFYYDCNCTPMRVHSGSKIWQSPSPERTAKRAFHQKC